MYSVFFAILMGLLCPSHSNHNHQGNGTVQTMGEGEQGTGGDTGDVRPPKNP
ncbi:hypothetical protein ACFQRK_12080 [Parapedobacter sp. GCM10030251]|uniref:hypothetical protein n=1 Tax=Parapedobacter sp. GCM10030251 TaxID=3273419 RepID=UPI0026C5DD33